MFRLIFLVSTVPTLVFAQSSNPARPEESPYVQRMMSLDRNRDGLLSKEELPGKLSELLSHDSNSDGKLNARELARIERDAIAKRNGGAVNTESAGRGRRGRPRRRNATTGSPLDAQQILRFALTFDADGDGGLNADELQRYAAALAVRRAEARKRHSSNEDETQEDPPPRSENPNKPKGLGTPDKDDKSPFDDGGF